MKTVSAATLRRFPVQYHFALSVRTAGMRLTTPAGLAVRVVLSGGVATVAFLASVTVVAAFGAMGLGSVLSVAGSDLPMAWRFGVVAVVVFPIVLVAITHTIRLERLSLLENATPVSETDHPSEIGVVATRLAAQFDMTPPQLRVHPSETPVAYTTDGPNAPVASIHRTESPIVVVSAGLIEALADDELEAVLAHEFAHVSNDDLRLTSWLLVPLHAVEFCYRVDGGRDRGIDPIGRTIRSVALVGVGIFARGRELAADRGAVAATGNPGALASALIRLENHRMRPDTDLRAKRQSTSAINVVPAIESTTDRGLLATHPPLSTRLEKLRSLADE